MKRFIFCLLLPFSAHAMDVKVCEANRAQMIDKIYQDGDYKTYVCGDSPCSQNEFNAQIEVDEYPATKSDNSKLCFAVPKQLARNFYTGVAVVRNSKMEMQFIFFGSGIGAKKTITNKFYDLNGVEIGDEGKNFHYTYQWNGHLYKEKK